MGIRLATLPELVEVELSFDSLAIGREHFNAHRGGVNLGCVKLEFDLRPKQAGGTGAPPRDHKSVCH